MLDEAAHEAAKHAEADAARRGLKVIGMTSSTRADGSRHFSFEHEPLAKRRAGRVGLAMTLSAAADAMPAKERRGFRSFLAEQAADPLEAPRAARPRPNKAAARERARPAQGSLL